MSDTLTLVICNKNYSSWSFRPWLLLRHHGIAFDEVRLPLETPEWNGSIGRWSPSGRLPVLHRGSLVVWDSLAIAEYVNENCLDGRGWPRDATTRAIARSISAEMHSGFQALRDSMPFNCRLRAKNFVVPPDARRDIDRITHIWRECRARAAGEGPFLFGGFTIADAMYAPVVMRFRTYGVATADVERRYVAAVLDLPAACEWTAAAEAEGLALPKYDAVAG
ncbi:MAG TPA: glutathione S-transferase family protein [Rhodanobacteraceae bacterium]|nr:glutathione S-transferase family protein [Rhodanobacteraceae bacterium]